MFPDILGMVFGVEFNLIAKIGIDLAFVWIVYLMGRSKAADSEWVLNGGAIIKVAVAVIVGALGIWYAMENGFANDMSAATFLPELTNTNALGYLSIIIFNFMGFEVICTMTDDMADPARDIPKAIIVGGLSILGTSVIVDPMSEQALVDTIHTEMDSRRAAGESHLLAFFGNYGVDFSRDELGLDVSQRVTISNYVGEMLDYAVYKDFSDVLLIGHIGKLIKVAQGIMNTHSRYADGRTTLLSLEAVFAGASRDLAKTIYDSLTTDEAVRILSEAGLLTPVMEAVCQKIDHYLEARTHGAIRTGAVNFSNVYGVLGYTSQAKDLLAVHQKGEVR